jgi:hypothetical protein
LHPSVYTDGYLRTRLSGTSSKSVALYFHSCLLLHCYWLLPVLLFINKD